MRHAVTDGYQGEGEDDEQGGHRFNLSSLFWKKRLNTARHFFFAGFRPVWQVVRIEAFCRQTG